MSARLETLPLLSRTGSPFALDAVMSVGGLLMTFSSVLQAGTWIRYGPSPYRQADMRVNVVLSLVLVFASMLVLFVHLAGVRRLGPRIFDLPPSRLRYVHGINAVIWFASLGAFLVRPPTDLSDLRGILLPGYFVFQISLPALLVRGGLHEGGLCNPSMTFGLPVRWSAMRSVLVAEERGSLIVSPIKGRAREIPLATRDWAKVREIVSSRVPTTTSS